jgi:hypothetical protein
VTESDSVGTDAELRSPFFGDGLRETCYAGFGEGVVGLAARGRCKYQGGLDWVKKYSEGRDLRIAGCAAGAADIDNIPWFAIFDSEIGGCCSDELERSCIMNFDDSIPLFVGHLQLWVSLEL